jgi:uncharacterized protein (DUF1684 family)
MGYEQQIDRWHARRVASLTGPDGWLSLVGLHWLRDGANTIGSDPAADVVLPGKVQAHLGTIEVNDGRAVLRRTAGELPLQDDRDGDPTIVRLGTLSFHVINREGRLALRVKDAESPARQTFRGIERYPVDPRWRVDAMFEAFDPPRDIPVPNVLGFSETMSVPGIIRFRLEGQECSLLAFLEEGPDLFLVFGDRTNGEATYGGGRYLYSPAPKHGTTVVDFNKAYNPPCVFTPFATCVLPLPENRLSVLVEAGEKRYVGQEGLQNQTRKG